MVGSSLGGMGAGGGCAVVPVCGAGLAFGGPLVSERAGTGQRGSRRQGPVASAPSAREEKLQISEVGACGFLGEGLASGFRDPAPYFGPCLLQQGS